MAEHFWQFEIFIDGGWSYYLPESVISSVFFIIHGEVKKNGGYYRHRAYIICLLVAEH